MLQDIISCLAAEDKTVSTPHVAHEADRAEQCMVAIRLGCEMRLRWFLPISRVNTSDWDLSPPTDFDCLSKAFILVVLPSMSDITPIHGNC